ncbi:MAG TPA: ferritin-like domain-containing protein, partial [Thermoanaerobaculia bacterium]|nr:ferritin-like domain-containing protein [Thermoanaerobaculia bacterium]
MNIYKVLPSLTRERQIKIWHKALRSQWSAADLNWEAPAVRLGQRHLRDKLARILTPILMGEQSALYSVSGLIPVLGHRSEVEGQFYLTTWAVDEARHTELFTRFYERIDSEPMSIRRFPSGYLFQSQIVSKEPAEWLSGVLISEVLAQLVMREFERLDIDAVLSEIAHGILRDEARHLGFNHIYLEDRFGDLYRDDPEGAEAYAEHLRKHLTKVLSFVPPMFDAVDSELAEIGIDRHQLFEQLSKDAMERLDKSISAGKRLAERKGGGEEGS